MVQTDPNGTTNPHWRVAPKLPVLKLAGTALLLLTGWLLADGDPVRLVLANVVAAALFA